ncbi:energy transducer TonB [Flammeovirga agarivorans]|uniref:TonB C-terminal domain-containing protein n=1 Tax=Flammeovirga agarivorans TaxID=2726742 RepID=A0A7X8SRF5_9BACT|nr:hypothetical protein [Flammeovirga agarivorans]NLR95037.1 hypothetical protein [Flammeovirga agarivorans]
MRNLFCIIFILLSFDIHAQEANCISKLDSLTGFQIYEQCDVIASPKSGFNKFYKEIANTVKFSSNIKNFSIDPKIFISLIINEDGSVSSIRVLHGKMNMIANKDDFLDLLNNTLWNPAQCFGKPVKSLKIFPIIVCLK